ncbi:hypothetical protein CLW00_10256 [Mongoliibacter ruber]|uniref:Uncharacterized protein n=1 Tax=Mongoliibacter ruber TaxID=1750599 RepID=A0A2T0WSB4_9BACT|nr:hypothetical protein CLW00_10256 [Mongoliibacter ruber]
MNAPKAIPPYIFKTFNLLNLSKNHNTITGRTNPISRLDSDSQNMQANIKTATSFILQKNKKGTICTVPFIYKAIRNYFFFFISCIM